VAWAEVYFRTKWHLHQSSRLATIDMNQKLRAAHLLGGDLRQHLTQRRMGRGVYLRTKWHLSPSMCLASTDIGRKLGGSAPFLGRGLGPHPTQSRLG